MWEWLLANWQEILLVVFGLALVYAALNIKKVLKEVHDFTDAVNEFVNSLCMAAEDDKLTHEEWEDIRKAWVRVMAEAKDIGAMAFGIAQILARVIRRKG